MTERTTPVRFVLRGKTIGTSRDMLPLTQLDIYPVGTRMVRASDGVVLAYSGRYLGW